MNEQNYPKDYSKMQEIMELSDKLGHHLSLLEELSSKINFKLNGSNDRKDSIEEEKDSSGGSLDEVNRRLRKMSHWTSRVEYNLNNIINSID